MPHGLLQRPRRQRVDAPPSLRAPGHRELTIGRRTAAPADAATIAAILAEAFDGYRGWAPCDWTPPDPTAAAEVSRIAAALGRADVWCQLALSGAEPVGHVALSLNTLEDPDPPPVGTVNLWMLFVRAPWHGRGAAPELMGSAIAEAGRRGFERLRLWTPRGAKRARRFYEREGWAVTGSVHEVSALGLPMVEYARPVASSM